jgi:ubiquinone/menaquinone biosynthesis C-methylase UbiE
MLGRKKRFFSRKADSPPILDANEKLAIPHPEFDELAYLRCNPDIAAWINSDPGYSGWKYFVEQGYLENRIGVSLAVCERVRRAKTYEVDHTSPPAYLRKRVHGASDVESFENVGRAVAISVLDHLKRVETSEPELKVLDLGVGCGRVLRPLADLYRKSSNAQERTRWYGADIDGQAIEWCRMYFGSYAEFVVNDIAPPLPFGDDCFDFIYCISIFTHLPENLQFAWLKEISRVLKVDGRAVLSTLPLEAMSKPEADKQTARGFRHPVGKGTQGLPKIYQDSYHSREYIETEWSKYIAIESFTEKGINNQQDLIVCRPLDK